MNLQALISIAVKVSVMLSVFAIGLKADLQHATYLLRRPGELVRAVLAMNVLMPVFAVALVLLFHLRPAVEIALVALAVSPIPPLLPKKLMKSGGTASYAIGLLIAMSLLSIVFVPVAMEILERVFNVPLGMSLVSIATVISETVLVPIGLGVAVHRLWPGAAERLAGPISVVAGIGLVVSVIAISFAAAPAIWTLIGNGTVVALAAFVLAGLAIGHYLGGPEPANRPSLAISTASRHPGIAVALGAANFPEQKLVMAAVLLYVLVAALVSMPYNLWIKRRLPLT